MEEVLRGELSDVILSVSDKKKERKSDKTQKSVRGGTKWVNYKLRH